MGDNDLIKVDKANVKLDKYITMLQVKYGYTREQATEEVKKTWWCMKPDKKVIPTPSDLTDCCLLEN
jgi:hypothetical protein